MSLIPTPSGTGRRFRRPGTFIAAIVAALMASVVVAGAALTPPGVIVATTPLPETEYIGSPSIVSLPDGRYVASHDFFGKKGEELDDTWIYVSSDRGATWSQTVRLSHVTWGTLFVHRGALYHMGITHEYGDVVIRRSDDGGRTWTEPVDARHGRIFQGSFHSAPVPVVVHGGRVWRAVEEVVNDRKWPRHFAAVVVSAPADADLLDAKNWIRTNGIVFDESWLPGDRPGWLEGNAVVGPDGEMLNILRVNTEVGPDGPFDLSGPAHGIPRYEVGARCTVSADGTKLAFDPTRGFFHFPGGQSKFTIRHDAVSGRYWALVNRITLPHEERDKRVSPIAQRNVVALVSSADLREWREETRILRWREGEKLTRDDRRAFQYLDWQFDGDDIVAVARTAWDAQNFHNANLLTFHRVPNFRRLTAADSAPNLVPTQP